MKLSPEEVGRIIAQSRFDVNEEIDGSIRIPLVTKWFLIKKWSCFLITDVFGPYPSHQAGGQVATTICLAHHDQAASLFKGK